MVWFHGNWSKTLEKNLCKWYFQGFLRIGLANGYDPDLCPRFPEIMENAMGAMPKWEAWEGEVIEDICCMLFL